MKKAGELAIGRLPQTLITIINTQTELSMADTIHFNKEHRIIVLIDNYRINVFIYLCKYITDISSDIFFKPIRLFWH